MSKPSLAQWLERLERLHPKEMELGLDRVTAVARRLDLLPLAAPTITVAGTNGKGSTVAVLEALLTRRGHVVGAFTSPHFRRFNERIRISGEEVADDEIIAAFGAIDAAREAISLTYFEFATLAALLLFRQRSADVVLLEVGLGGRLDSVNIVDAQIAVITSIDLDHQEWLGHSRAEIAREKAGIIRPGMPLVIADPAPPDELMACADRVGASPVLAIGRDFSVETEEQSWRCELKLADGRRRQLAPQRTGSIVPANVCAALQAALLLGEDFTDSELRAALDNCAPAGRRELRVIRGIEYIMDVAHNPAAVLKLVEYLNVGNSTGKLVAIFSVMADKDIPAMIQGTAGVFQAWFLADQPGNPRAAAASDLAGELRLQGQHRISISKNLTQAFRRAQGILTAGDRLVVFGSFYTVAEVLPLLEKDSLKYGAGAGE